MKHGGLRVLNPKGISEFESPDCRNEIIAGNRLKTRPGMVKVNDAALGNPINFLLNVKSGFCKENYKLAIDNSGKIIIGLENYYNIALLFDGTNDYIEIGDGLNQWFEKAFASFSISMWVYVVSDAGNSISVLIANHDDATNTGFFIAYSKDDKMFYSTIALGSSWNDTNLSTGVNSVSFATWYHLVLTVSGDTIKIYLDSILKNTITGTRTSIGDIVTLLSLAYDSNRGVGNSHFNGLLFDVRVYSSVLALTDIESIYAVMGPDNITTNRISRWMLNEKDNGIIASGTDSIYDIGESVLFNHGVSMEGDAELGTTLKKFSTASLLLGGAGHCSIAYSDDWDFGSDDFTIDFWLYIPSAVDITSWSGYITRWGDAGSVIDYVFYIGGATTLGAELRDVDNNSFYIDGGAITKGQWQHWALMRLSNVLYMYRGGVLQNTTAMAPAMMSSDPPLIIGKDESADRYCECSIDELRISNTGRYSGNFTPETSEYETDSYTKLLLHFNGVDGATTTEDESDQLVSARNHGTPYGGPIYTAF